MSYYMAEKNVESVMLQMLYIFNNISLSWDDLIRNTPTLKNLYSELCTLNGQIIRVSGNLCYAGMIIYDVSISWEVIQLSVLYVHMCICVRKCNLFQVNIYEQLDMT